MRYRLDVGLIIKAFGSRESDHAPPASVVVCPDVLIV